MSAVTASDFFCGAGGSSTGMATVPGLEVVIAANHWQLAIDVHNTNHPNTDHAAADLHLTHPSFFPTTDIGWFSPECTKWSQANGSKPLPAIEEGLFEDPLSNEAASRSRLLMFDVLRLAEYHRYRALIVENVVDIATQEKYALAWYEWRRQLSALGYRFRVVSLNSMHAQTYGAPAPQSRDRIYVVCWRQGERAPDLERILRPRAFCPKCDELVRGVQSWKNGKTVGRYRQTYVYVHATCGTVVEPGWLPAAAAIDWTLPGERIGDRSKPLAEKTFTRIAAGIARYWGPLQLEASGNTYDAANPQHPRYGDPNAYYRAWSTSEEFRTLHTDPSKALAIPMEGRDGKEARELSRPLRTMTTRLETALVAEFYGTSTARPVTEPAGTFMAGGNHHGLVQDGREPFVTQFRERHRDLDPRREPLRTIVADGASHALLSPAGGTWNDDARPSTDPLRTLTSRDAYALVQRMNNGGAEMTTPTSDYLRTLTTTGHQALLTGSRETRRQITPGDIARARELVPEVLFRMFEPHEVAAGMAFPDTYRWDVKDSRGRTPSKRDLTKMAGNAVTPPAARDIAHVVVEALTGYAVAA